MLACPAVLSREQPAARPRRLVFAVGWLIVLTAVAWVVAIRVHASRMPIDRDVGIYTVIGHEMTHGRRLYTDLFDHKPPAIYLTFAAAEMFTGYGGREGFFANLVGVLATLLGFLFICRRAATGLSGLWMLVIAALASSCLQLEAINGNSELFINAFLVGAFACLTPAESTWPRLLGAAAFTAIASLYKHVAVIPGVAVISMLVLDEWLVDQKIGKAVGRLSAAAGVIAGFWTVTALYFVFQGRGADFYDAMVRFNIGYAGFEKGHWISKTLVHLLEVFQGGVIVPLLTLVTLLLAPALFFIPGTVSFRRICRMTSAYLAGAFVAVVLPDRYFTHYFQLLYPPVAIACGLLATAAARRAWWTPRALAHALCLVIALPLAADSARSLRLTPADGPARFGFEYVDPQKMSGELNRLLKPSETFFNWGEESWLYVYSHRSPPAGIFIADHIREGALKRKLTDRTLAALEKNRPEILVVSRWVSPKKAFEGPVGQWMLANYRLLPGGNRGYLYLMARKDGRLLAQTPSIALPGAGALDNHFDAVTKKVDPRLAAVERG